jgi:hypothetical protein
MKPSLKTSPFAALIEPLVEASPTRETWLRSGASRRLATIADRRRVPNEDLHQLVQGQSCRR